MAEIADILRANSTPGFHPDFAPKLTLLQQILREHYGLDTKIASGRRDDDTQAKLFAQGRTAPGAIVTNARPGDSYHNYGAAADVVPVNMPQKQSEEVMRRAFAENPQLGLTWGGSFKSLYDPNHVQLGVPLDQLRAGAPQNATAQPAQSPPRQMAAQTSPLTDVLQMFAQQMTAPQSGVAKKTKKQPLAEAPIQAPSAEIAAPLTFV